MTPENHNVESAGDREGSEAEATDRTSSGRRVIEFSDAELLAPDPQTGRNYLPAVGGSPGQPAVQSQVLPPAPPHVPRSVMVSQPPSARGRLGSGGKIAAIAALVIVFVGVAGFFIGLSTRKSDANVYAQIAQIQKAQEKKTNRALTAQAARFKTATANRVSASRSKGYMLGHQGALTRASTLNAPNREQAYQNGLTSGKQEGQICGADPNCYQSELP